MIEESILSHEDVEHVICAVDSHTRMDRDREVELGFAISKELDEALERVVPYWAFKDFDEEPFLGVGVADVRAFFDVIRRAIYEVLQPRSYRHAVASDMVGTYVLQSTCGSVLLNSEWRKVRTGEGRTSCSSSQGIRA